jgi:hypothetical protein
VSVLFIVDAETFSVSDMDANWLAENLRDRGLDGCYSSAGQINATLTTLDVDPIKLGKEDVFIVASSLRGSNVSKHATLGKLFGALKRRAGDSGPRTVRLP